MFCTTQRIAELYSLADFPSRSWFHNLPDHDQRVCHDVRNSEPKGGEGVVRDHVFEHHNRDAASQASSHQSKPEEQNKFSLPRNTIAGITEAVSTQAGLVNAVNDEHAKGGADGRDPVDECDVDVRAVLSGLGVGSRIDEEEETEGELSSQSAID